MWIFVFEHTYVFVFDQYVLMYVLVLLPGMVIIVYKNNKVCKLRYTGPYV